jgi:hypothetical protein
MNGFEALQYKLVEMHRMMFRVTQNMEVSLEFVQQCVQDGDAWVYVIDDASVSAAFLGRPTKGGSVSVVYTFPNMGGRGMRRC